MVKRRNSSPPSSPEEWNIREVRPEDLWNGKIDKNIVTKAVYICKMTYVGHRMGDTKWETGFNDEYTRCVLGKNDEEDRAGTRCVFLYEAANATIFIGFRGSVDKHDWLSNLDIKLTNTNKEDDVRVHRGFLKRADDIFEELPKKISEMCSSGKELKIITTGHSLGAAISQLIHIKLWEKFSKAWKCQLVNVTFATPMVGNNHLRERLHSNLAADLMHHFVMEEDVVPPSLFTHEVYQKLPWYATEDNLNRFEAILRIVGQVSPSSKKIEKLMKDNDIMQSIKNLFKELEEQQPRNNMMGAYMPVGHYYYVKTERVHCLELPFDYPEGVKDTLVSALDVMNITFFKRWSLERDLRKNKERSTIAREASRLAAVHGIENYYEKLQTLGFVEKKRTRKRPSAN